MSRTRLILKVMLLMMSLLLSGLPVFAHAEEVPTSLLVEDNYLMRIENTTGRAGDINHVFHITGSWNVSIREYSIKLFYNSTEIQIVNISLDGCVGINASSFNTENNPPGGYFGAVVQKTEGIPAGEGTLLAIIINISINASRGKTTLHLDNGTATYYNTTDNITLTPITYDGHLDIRTGNHPPGQPVIHGPVAGGSEIELNFSAVSTDFEGDNLSYKWDWGDGNVTGWIGPFNANASMTINHIWLLDGAYVIKVKTKDTTDNESDWSNYSLSIARQIEFKGVQPGYIYIRIFTFNKSFFYINLLNMLGVAVIIGTSGLMVEVAATDTVQLVRFEALKLLSGESTVLEDGNGSNGFSCSLDISGGVYQLMVTAYDADGNLIDGQILPCVIFLRIGQAGISGGLRHTLR